MSTISSSPRYHWLADRTTRWFAKMIDTGLLLLAMTPAYLAQPEKLPQASPNPVWLFAGLLLLFSGQGYFLFHNGQTLV